MKHLEIPDELHEKIRIYCFLNHMTVKCFVRKKLEMIDELKNLASYESNCLNNPKVGK